MVNVAAYAGAGLLQGLGKGMVEDAASRRQQALDELRFAREQQMRQEDRAWQQQTRAEDRAARMSERVEDRQYDEKMRREAWDREDARSAEDRAYRERMAAASSDAERAKIEDERRYERERAAEERSYKDKKPGKEFTGADGFIYVQPEGGGPAERVTDAEGNPIRGGKNGNQPMSDAQKRLLFKEFGEQAQYGDPDAVMAAVDEIRTYNVDPADIAVWARNRLKAGGMSPEEIEAQIAQMGLPSKNSGPTPDPGSAPGASSANAPPKPGSGGMPMLGKGGAVEYGGVTWYWTGTDWTTKMRPGNRFSGPTYGEE